MIVVDMRTSGLAAVKLHHGVFQRALVHLPVRHGESEIGQQSLDPLCKGIYAFYAVIQHERLSSAVDLAGKGVAQERVRFLRNVGLHGQPLLGRGIDGGYIPYARKRHVQGAGNGRCRKRERIDVVFQQFYLFLVLHAEPLFLVQHQKAEVFEIDVRTQKAVRADDEVLCGRPSRP